MHTANYYLVKDFHCQEIRDGSIPSQYAPCSFSPNCQDVDKKELTNNLIMLILKRCIQQRKKTLLGDCLSLVRVQSHY